MTTIRLRISDSKIKKISDDVSVSRLRDERYPLEFRYHKSRQTGTWWLIDKRKKNGRSGRAKWERLGTWPRLKSSALFELMPIKVARMATENDRILTTWKQFSDCLRWYLERVSSNPNISNDRRVAVVSVINRHILPAVGHLPLDYVRKHEINDLFIRPLQADGYSIRTIKSYFAMLKAAFSQAKKEELLDINPLADVNFSDFIKKPIKNNPLKLHSFMLNDLFRCLLELKASYLVFVLLQLMYATRITETRLAKWSHFNWDEKVWRIPADHTKTKEELYLPLTDQVIELLRWFHSQSTGPYLFSSNNYQPICKDTANDIYKKLPLDFTSHHCRKFTRTQLANLGVDYFVGERIINHKLSGLDQKYVFTTTEQLKRKALQGYHDYLDNQGLFFLRGKILGRS